MSTTFIAINVITLVLLFIVSIVTLINYNDSPDNIEKRRIMKVGSLIVSIALLVNLSAMSAHSFTVIEKESSTIVYTLNGIKKEKLSPGIHFLNPISYYEFYSKNTRIINVTLNDEAKTAVDDYGVTIEGKMFLTLKEENMLELVKTVGAVDNFLEDNLLTSYKVVTSNMTWKEILENEKEQRSTKRYKEKIKSKMREITKEKLNELINEKEVRNSLDVKRISITNVKI